ncbi:FMN-dependent NADH-azoreductase [Halomonas salinarum]|uniref:FMN-dependent NADH-azoreductase n=1 Tax=Halomonas salinarum TaxID=1158993 RepID=UPI001FD7DA32|nr:NAD(P)H-dependent oxidoreductase [Halomonas salinarum]
MTASSTKVLVVTSSILGDNSQSRALAGHFMQSLEGRDDVTVTERDLVANELPHLDIDELSSWGTDSAERSAKQAELLKRSDELIEELLEHDVLVLAVPLYNLGIPSQLKAWFDRILRSGQTFRYTENGPQGLVEGKRALVMTTRGGQYVGTEMDSQTPHLKSMLGLMGISDVEMIFAEGLAMGEKHAAATMKEAHQAIDSYIERF